MIASWLQAARLPSQLYICVPLIVGQLFAVESFSELNFTVFVLIQAFGLFDQLFIVFSNDYYDVETDKLNTRSNLFTGGSRVVPENKISRKHLLWASYIMAAFCVAVGLFLTLNNDLVWILPMIVFGLFLMVLYSFPPFQFSYRGGGEILQAIGVGGVLPLIGYYAQSGQILSFPWIFLAVFLPTQLACALSTTIPDRFSDKTSGKKTFTVQIGLASIRNIIAVLQLICVCSLILVVGKSWVVGASLTLLLAFQSSIFLWPLKDQTKEVVFVGLSIAFTTAAMLVCI